MNMPNVLAVLPKVAVVILNWNGLRYLQTYLPSVLASTYPNLEIILGDNGSTDGSVEFVRTNFPLVKTVLNDQNYGFTGGYNRVLAQVQADYFILLNSDVEVVPNWIEPVIRLMESDKLIAAAAPKILSWLEKTKFDHAGAAGGFIDTFGYPFCRGRIFFEIEEDRGQYDQTIEVLWASGAALFIKQKYWELSGGFDERFFAHMEEIDLCWRLNAAGYKVMYCPQSVIYHLGGGSLSYQSPRKTYFNFRNNIIMCWRNSPWEVNLWLLPLRMMMDGVAALQFLVQKQKPHTGAVLRAYRDFFRWMFSNGKDSPRQKLSLRKAVGVARFSVVWNYFIRKKKTFREMK